MSCSHPAGGAQAKIAHARALVNEAKGTGFVIAGGDFNFKQKSTYYKLMTGTLVDSWLAVWPDGVGDMSAHGIHRGKVLDRPSSGVWLDKNHLDMKTRIDHIFVSPNVEVLESVYLPVPDSQTDHPAHWTVLRFKPDSIAPPGQGRLNNQRESLLFIREKKN